jgi:hypothetical protein
MAPHAFCAETFVVALVCYSLFSLVYLLLLHLQDYCAQLCAWAASASGGSAGCALLMIIMLMAR